MASVPGECQTLADQVASLEQQYSSLAAAVSNAVGQDAWSGLARLGALRLKLTSARAALAACIEAHSAALTANVVVMDASGGSPSGPQVATLWDLTGNAPAPVESSQVQAGAFGFQRPVPARAAITIATTGVPQVTGLDFRSGPLESGPGSARVEMVIGPVLSLTQDRLDSWASAFQPAPQQLTPTLSATINTVTARLGQDAIAIGVNGLLSGEFANVALPQTSFSASVSVGLFPSAAPQGGEIVRVALAGASPVQVELSQSLLGALVSALLPLASSSVAQFVQGAVTDWVNLVVPTFTAEMLSLLQLPGGVSISLRSVAISVDGIAFQPMLGVIGTALSTFRPPIIPPPP